MSGKSPTKLEATSRHDHSCLLERKASSQIKCGNALSIKVEPLARPVLMPAKRRDFPVYGNVVDS